MKRFGIVLILSVLLWTRLAIAVPMLQLDIEGGTYDSTPGVETIIAPGTPFTLYALLTPKTDVTGAELTALFEEDYFISAAVQPAVSLPGSTLGSFKFDVGADDIDVETINVTEDLIYGNPPVESIPVNLHDGGDLGPHGIFPTYFMEFTFQFDSAKRATTYNSLNDPGGLIDNSSGGTYFAEFSIDTTLLFSENTLHFDLYNTKVQNLKKNLSIEERILAEEDLDTDDFAPFSHDAQSDGLYVDPFSVPEPSGIILLGLGLLGWAGFRKKSKR